MNLELDESLKLCDWLRDKGLTLNEAAQVLSSLSCGDALYIALLKIYKNRRDTLEKLYDKKSIEDWGNPIVP